MPQTVTRSSRLLGLVGLLVALTMMVAWVPVSRAVAPGSIAGTVTTTDTNPAPIEGVEVALYQLFGDGYYASWEAVDYTETGADGTYSFDPIDAGTYRVGFTDLNGVYAAQFYNGSTSLNGATDLVVDGAPLVDVNAQMGAGGSIEGTVTDATDAPLANVYVAVYLAEINADNGTNYYFVNDGFTDEVSGTYSIGGLNTGSYIVEFITEGGRVVYSGGKNSMDAADRVPVIAGDPSSGIDVKIGGSGSISGNVTDDSTPAAAIADVDIYAYDTDGNFVGYAMTDEAGSYTIADLEAGSYKLEAYDFEDRYAPEFYDNTTVFTAAVSIPITTTAKAGINFALTTGAAPDVSVDGDVYSSDDPTNGDVSVTAGSWSDSYDVTKVITCATGTPISVTLLLTNTESLTSTFSYPMADNGDGSFTATITNVKDLLETPYTQSVAYSCSAAAVQAPVSTIVLNVGNADRNSALQALGTVKVFGPYKPNTVVTLFKVPGYTPRSVPADATKAKTCPSAAVPGTASATGIAGVPVNTRTDNTLLPATNPIELRGSPTGEFGWQFQNNAAGCYYVEASAPGSGFKTVRSGLFGVTQSGASFVTAPNAVSVVLSNGIYLPFISR